MPADHESGNTAGPGSAKVDVALVQRVRDSVEGADVSKAAHLILNYRTCADYFCVTGDLSLLEAMRDCEAGMMRLLARSRLKKAWEAWQRPNHLGH